MRWKTNWKHCSTNLSQRLKEQLGIDKSIAYYSIWKKIIWKQSNNHKSTQSHSTSWQVALLLQLKIPLFELRSLWKSHSVYSPDIASSNFHLFRSMQHGLSTRFWNTKEIWKWIDDWITSRDKSFYRRELTIV